MCMMCEIQLAGHPVGADLNVSMFGINKIPRHKGEERNIVRVERDSV